MYRRWVSNPKSWCCRFRKLWPSRAAAESSTRDIAACAITRDFCAHERPPPTERLAPRSASTGSACEVTHAGAIPKIIPVRTEMPSVKSSTGKEGVAVIGTLVIGAACLKSKMQNQPCCTVRHGDAQCPTDRGQHDSLHYGLANSPPS